jgi:hypothetical protein
MLASLATGPYVFAQTGAHHKTGASAHQTKHIVGAQDSAAAAAAAQAPAPAAQPGGAMDTAAGAMAAPAPAPAPTGGFVDTTGTGTYGGQTSSAGGTYDQATGRGHNWGWIGLFGLLGLLGLRGRTPTTTVDDRTTTARPHVNARP